MLDDETVRYKKKAKKKTPKKADHKHEFVTCVYGYNKRVFSKERGFENVPDLSIRTYCPVCGKVGTSFDYENERYVLDNTVRKPSYICPDFDWTDEAKREFNPKTRTLPYFWIKDKWFTKYVELEDKG